MIVSPESRKPESAAADEPPGSPGHQGATAWHSLSAAEALQAQDAAPEGLSEAEASARLARFGANRLPRAQAPGALALYVRQFKSPLVYLLLAASVVSVFVGEWSDALFIHTLSP